MRSIHKLHAVVDVGGCLGIEQKELALPLGEMAMKDGELVTTTASTTEALKDRKAFNAPGYIAVKGDQLLSEALAQAPEKAGDTPDFATPDQDDNPYLSREEASQASALIERWDQADRAGDGRIDRVELSAFEANLAGSGSKASTEGAQKDQAE